MYWIQLKFFYQIQQYFNILFYSIFYFIFYILHFTFYILYYLILFDIIGFFTSFDLILLFQ